MVSEPMGPKLLFIVEVSLRMGRGEKWEWEWSEDLRSRGTIGGIQGNWCERE